jgi:hypothetical protein
VPYITALLKTEETFHIRGSVLKKIEDLCHAVKEWHVKILSSKGYKSFKCTPTEN